jgi:acetylornithine deacetylase/succinyl-diaminopimelate desuccinylase-like protein
VPFRATLEIDLRDTDLAARERALAHIRQTAEEVCARRGCKLEFKEVNADRRQTVIRRPLRLPRTFVASFGVRSQRMISRAYHDSLFMARVCPTTMLFIPCRNGWSHRPDEYAKPEHIAAGVEVLAHTLARLAE